MKTVTTLIAIAAAATLWQSPAKAATTTALAPDVAASVWQEGEMEYATVTFNGKELVTFQAISGTGTAGVKAEDLAIKLQALLEDKKLNVNDLLPSRFGDSVGLQLHGTTVLSFDLNDTLSDSDAADKDADKEKIARAKEMSWSLVNDIRAAYGAPLLPQALNGRIAEQNGLAASMARRLAHAGKAVSSFTGKASWYGPHFHGRRTSDGTIYNQDGMTAAHRTLPFGTRLLVVNRNTGESCVVKVNDRGPFVGDRVLDLSRGAARQLNMMNAGVVPVACLILSSTD
jgi:rare lipoprotein A